MIKRPEREHIEASNNFRNLKQSVFFTFLLMSVSLLLFHGCTDPIDPDPDLKITGISIPSDIYVVAGGEITITGKGFKIGDQIVLLSTTDGSIEYTITVSIVSELSATFEIPAEFSSGSYRITVVRLLESQVLGTVFINVTSDTDIPDIDGMTIKGQVYCNGEGLSGVVVSDGYELTVTDENGIYYLPSEKKNEYVFISVPGNYEVTNNNNLPQFFKRLAGGSSVERKDFSLIETDNTNHVLLAMADWHLANRNSDVAQFSSGFLQDVNATIDKYIAQGTKVYGLTLGDLTWELYWYSNQFALPEYLLQMYKINCTIFNLIGNHDNDPYKVGDWLTVEAYKEIIGPNYYSFNLGEVHYIVLDNVEYLNSGGSEGVIGTRNYNNKVVSYQMEWLEKDLATLQDPNTPIVIGIHIPLYKQPIVDGSGNYTPQLAMSNGSDFLSLIESFSNVHVLSGHAHRNFSVEVSPSLMEHNTGAVCATWWWTGKPGYAGNHICGDGSPGGYGVWEMNGIEQEWYYKSIGYEKEYQFRTYDLNSVHITAENYAPNSTDEALAVYAGEYSTPSVANEVLINIWGYDKDWTIEVIEEGTLLDITYLNDKDPLHIISYEAQRLDHGATPTSSFITKNTPHLFKVKASGPVSTLEISVMDRFGNVYSETMTRPKAFTCDMR